MVSFWEQAGGGMKLHSNHGRKVLFCWKLAFGLSFLFSVSASKAVCSSVCYLKLTLSWRKWAMSEVYNHCLPRKKLLYKKMAGVLVIPKGKGKDACRLGANFTIPPNTVDWIAFDARGNCTFKEKIKAALGKGSSDVLIYAHSCLDRKCFIFLHGGAGDIAARMINSRKVKQILRLIQAGIRVTATTEMLTTPCFTATYLCECSLMLTFVFFVFVCYIARKMVGRQGEQPTKTELKNAIHSLESRKLKKGEFELAEETCVVCFEAYKVREVVRILTCKHIFHKRCIDPWLLKQGTCPLCNSSIIKN
ncbi:E3 ubiquitin-protein ligase RNF133-like [Sceloporus undulatus]|uniref:E3 ubiquitin-protein ligase RNF133-like n=1 Tax=Sceloporus undulatus TaxID=8520 RepID=UPI001C4BB59C|nr:E3 ubiquitin-protein ligase RNF133-like [Sceloporus undulatus]